MGNFSLISGIKLLILALTMSLGSCVSLDEDDKPQVEKALKTHQAIVINHLNRGEPEKAFVELRPTLQRFPENVDLITLMGLTQLAMKNPRNAIKYLKKADDMESSSTTILNYSSALIENRQNVAALKLLKKHLKEDDIEKYAYPERIYHNVGLAYRNIKKNKGASHYFRKAIEQNPKFYLSLMQLGDINTDRKRHKAARSYYRKALPACNQCYEALQALTNSYMASGNQQGAATVLSAYANNKKIPNNLRNQARKQMAKLNPDAQKKRSAKYTRPKRPTKTKR